MSIPRNIIVNADDLGMNQGVNEAILLCYKKKIINSTSLLTNTRYFDDTIKLIKQNPAIVNIGVHVNLADNKPVSNFKLTSYLDDAGNWDVRLTNKKLNFFGEQVRIAFIEEIYTQIEQALAASINITHLDSHYHLHTLPCFYKLFLQAAKRYKLRLRLAQTYYENSYIKLLYRNYINSQIKKRQSNYSDRFETVHQFLKNGTNNEQGNKLIELMLHPVFDFNGKLSDHYDPGSIADWISFIE